MNVLVIGKTGQVAHSLREKASDYTELELSFVGRPEVDLVLPGAARSAIVAARPDMVINAAAYTAVDQAEDEPEIAFRINADAAGEIAGAAAQLAIPIIQLSTDYVFDGRSAEPYSEEAETNPVNVYGRSKLAGEDQVRAVNPRHLIIRTSWVYSPFGHNFVKTMMTLADTRDELRVVGDQSGCPTSALDIADVLLRLCAAPGRGKGTFHLAGPGITTWAGLAEQVMLERDRHGLSATKIIPIPSAEWPTKAARPANSALACTRFEQEFGFALPDWQSSVAEAVRLLARSRAI